MATIDKLLKYLNAKTQNVAEFLDEEQLDKIANDVITGYEIDDDSRKQWLKVNKKAVEMVKNSELFTADKQFPFFKASKVVYPLIGPAIIQLAARLITQVVKNDRVAECAVLGKDSPMITQGPQGQPVNSGVGVKAAKAKRVSDYLSYKLLLESDTWLHNEHKMCQIVAGWGVAFKEVYYDPITKKCCSELIPPEDVIINHKTQCLDKCRRYTIRLYMTKNEIEEYIRSEQFLNVDLDNKASISIVDNKSQENDSRELQPVHEVLKQFIYLDLDDDGYDEPYLVYVHHETRKVLGIKPSFELDGININEKGNVLSIDPIITLIDRHLVDDPEGNYYSMGLNHLLFNHNRAITAILRELIDAGLLANVAGQSGFVTKAFKTKERAIRPQLGHYSVADVPPGVDLKSQIMNLPFAEPSNVLLELLQFLVQSGEKVGFISDILVGDTQLQNVPATSMLAAVEQSTRAFKPVVQKEHISLKKEFKAMFHYYSKYMDQREYFKFQGQDASISKDDFDESAMDIMPVADPTMSSEAHRYARLRAGLEFGQQFPQVINMQAFATYYFTELEYVSPEMFVAQPQPPQPSPDKVLEIQSQQQIAQLEQQVHQLKAQNEAMRIGLEDKKQTFKEMQLGLKAKESQAKIQKSIVDAHSEAVQTATQAKQVDIEQQNADTEARRVEVLANQSRDKDSSKSDSTGNSQS